MGSISPSPSAADAFLTTSEGPADSSLTTSPSSLTADSSLTTSESGSAAEFATDMIRTRGEERQMLRAENHTLSEQSAARCQMRGAPPPS